MPKDIKMSNTILICSTLLIIMKFRIKESNWYMPRTMIKNRNKANKSDNTNF